MEKDKIKSQKSPNDSRQSLQPSEKSVYSQGEKVGSQQGHCNQNQACINLTLSILSFWKNLLKQEMKKREVANVKDEQKESEEEQQCPAVQQSPEKSSQIQEDDVALFCTKFIQVFSEEVENKKKEYFEKHKDEFKKNCSRWRVQSEVDQHIFKKDTPKEEIMNYLQHPEDMINFKYEEYYLQSWKALLKQYKKKQKLTDIHKQFYSALSCLLSFLNQQHIEPNKQSLPSLFQFYQNSSQHDQLNSEKYLQKSNRILLEYLIDIIMKDFPNQVRYCKSIKIKPRHLFTQAIVISLPLKRILQKIKTDNKMIINNLVKFVTKMMTAEIKNFLQGEFNKIIDLRQKDKENYLEMIKVNICSKKCPGCGRICGLEGEHEEHQAVYGHQVRGLNGNYSLDENGNKQASTKTCEEIADSDLITYKGLQFTWSQYKEYCQQQPDLRWSFDDILENNNVSETNWKQAWMIAEPIICQRDNIEIIDKQYDNFKNDDNEKEHYIFAVNNSGISKGEPFQKMVSRLQEFVESLKKKDQGKNLIKISLLTFSSQANIIFQNLDLSEIKIEIPFSRVINTRLTFAFSKGNQLISKYIKQAKVFFIVLTCNETLYPTGEICNLEKLATKNQSKLHYLGIQFGNICKNMEKISLNLKNISCNQQQLFKSHQKENKLEIIKEWK